ncbi:aromatic ring-hydroxylating dioxygenase subunit alpha [Aestuariicella hydrocarbonica]|uniref:Aromatic ring-hydroxylating dioxygenase subunit alpha n=1 Tax=Pseudomaricurvus hydrocarbonicus TaxID=1470433 RepID=A0A9E5MN65_9GAMM|nr:aromatic ring-hydroxylating dioxygenase subunit alpha [Aestuariicella hydrocarbonica]NHO67348.1 aromatic ring-hydroxylating dioxygenase subunit alpha [Aestuariicella hydrocarbonica]
MSVQMHIPGVSDLTDETKSPFPLNQWYVAALSKELTDQPVGRTLLSQAVVLFRDGDGRVHALEDRCCHRALPLSSGTLEDAGIRCGYHGMLYNGGGQCIDIPGQDIIPPRAKVKSYQVKEVDGFIWMWFGLDQDAEPLFEPPNYAVHSSGKYLYDGDVYHYEAPYQLIHDNLLDLSHLGYVHLRTIGGDAKTHMNADMRVTGEGECVRVVRHMRDSLPPPTYTAAYPFKDRIDRWQEIEFLPTHLKIWTGAVDANSEDLNDPERGGFHMRGFHGVTPETETTSHYFWTIATNPQSDPEATLQKVVEQTALTFEEDKVVIEDQYQNMLKFGHAPMISIHVDAGANRARRIIEKLRSTAG